ncbi:hypothetical protein JTB14_030614 [Gonioctena quinquepunctata]|nr:hypothetical protein JTB14_030614 [Gonioctena quinquepunctata]
MDMANAIIWDQINEDVEDAEIQNHIGEDVLPKRNPFELSEQKFIKMFRLTEALTRQLIDIVQHHMQAPSRASALTVETKGPCIPARTQERRGNATSQTGAEYAGLPRSSEGVNQSPDPASPGRPTDTTRHFSYLTSSPVTTFGHTGYSAANRPEETIVAPASFSTPYAHCPARPNVERNNMPQPSTPRSAALNTLSLSLSDIPLPPSPVPPPPPTFSPTTPSTRWYADQIIGALRANPNSTTHSPELRAALEALLPLDRPQGRFRPASEPATAAAYARELVEGEDEFLSDRLSSRTGTTATLPEHRIESNSPFRPLYGSPLIHEPEENQNQWRPRINLNVTPAPERRVTFSENMGLERQGFARNSLPQETLAENTGSGRQRFAPSGPPQGSTEGNSQVYRPPQTNRFGNQDAQRHTENQNYRGNEYRNARSAPESAGNRQGRDFRQVENSTRQDGETLANDCEMNEIRREENACQVTVEDGDERLISLGGLEVRGNKLPRIPVTINGKSVLALLDTGASVNFVRPDVLKNMDLTGLPNPSVLQLGCQTSTSQSLGHVGCKIQIENESFKIRATVLSMLNEPLVLGMPFFQQTNAIMDVVHNCIYMGDGPRLLMSWQSTDDSIDKSRENQDELVGKEEDSCSDLEEEDELMGQVFRDSILLGPTERYPGSFNQITTFYDEVIQAQSSTPSVQRFIERWLRAKEVENPNAYEFRIRNEFDLIEGILYYVGPEKTQKSVVIPKTMFLQVMQRYHDNIGHPGVDETYRQVSEKFQLAPLKARVKDYVSRCLVCATTKAAKPQAEAGLRPNEPSRPWEMAVFLQASNDIFKEHWTEYFTEHNKAEIDICNEKIAQYRKSFNMPEHEVLREKDPLVDKNKNQFYSPKKTVKQQKGPLPERMRLTNQYEVLATLETPEEDTKDTEKTKSGRQKKKPIKQTQTKTNRTMPPIVVDNITAFDKQIIETWKQTEVYMKIAQQHEARITKSRKPSDQLRYVDAPPPEEKAWIEKKVWTDQQSGPRVNSRATAS